MSLLVLGSEKGDLMSMLRESELSVQEGELENMNMQSFLFVRSEREKRMFMSPDAMERLRSYTKMSTYLRCSADSSYGTSFQGKIFLVYLPKTEPLQLHPLYAV